MEKIALKLVQSMAFYPRYKSIYQQFISENPFYLKVGQLESKEDLEKLILKKTLFHIEVEGQWAGIIAADKMIDGWLEGFCIIEEMLDKPFRGKGFAAAAQRHLIEQLPSEKGDLIFGTIGHKNVPSLKTALRVGRISLGKTVFYEETKEDKSLQ